MTLKATTLIIVNFIALSSVTINEAWSSENIRKLLIGNKSDNTASIVDLENLKFTGEIRMGNEPDGMVFFRSDN